MFGSKGGYSHGKQFIILVVQYGDDISRACVSIFTS